MIPNDLAARLRLLVESAVQPLPQVRGLPTELPEFVRGQTFTAHIESALPDGSFRALVAGKQVTLSLEQGAKTGDTLELVVVERTPKLIAATLANRISADAQTAPGATLSRTAQLISALLAGQHEGQAEPAPLTRGQPLLASPPTSAAPLIPLLKQAAVQSGLFYESHQAQWVAGRVPLSALLQEPQGRLSPTLADAATPVRTEEPPGGASAEDAPAAQSQRPASAPAAAMRDPRLADIHASARTLEPGTQAADVVRNPDAVAKPSADSAGGAMPKELAPLVQQQLDALATHHLAWQGLAWPGQSISWEIEEPLRDHQGASDVEPHEWRTTVRLTMPLLGEVSAILTLTADGVAVALSAHDESTLARLDAGMGELGGALAAAGIPLRSFAVSRHEPG